MGEAQAEQEVIKMANLEQKVEEEKGKSYMQRFREGIAARVLAYLMIWRGYDVKCFIS